MADYTQWTPRDAAASIAVPNRDDDKYSRGVLGVMTGSAEYPGAAVLGVEAALHTGVGMVRYLGPQRASDLVLQRRPETVTVPGRVQAWLLGSGMDAATRSETTTEQLLGAIREALPTIIDAGALDLLGDQSEAGAATIITPHHRELAGVLGNHGVSATPEDVLADPAHWCALAADRLGVTVLLKGNRTHIAAPHGLRIVTPAAPAWLATAGTGDALGGILGALAATHAAELAEDPELFPRLAASAVLIHALAATRASDGGPLTVLDLAASLPATIAALLREHPQG